MMNWRSTFTRRSAIVMPSCFSAACNAASSLMLVVLLQIVERLGERGVVELRRPVSRPCCTSISSSTASTSSAGVTSAERRPQARIRVQVLGLARPALFWSRKRLDLPELEFASA